MSLFCLFQPPPTDSGQLEASPVKTNHGAFVTQQPIISMEDDEMSDQEMVSLNLFDQLSERC